MLRPGENTRDAVRVREHFLELFPDGLALVLISKSKNNIPNPEASGGG